MKNSLITPISYEELCKTACSLAIAMEFDYSKAIMFCERFKISYQTLLINKKKFPLEILLVYHELDKVISWLKPILMSSKKDIHVTRLKKYFTNIHISLMSFKERDILCDFLTEISIPLEKLENKSNSNKIKQGE